MRYLVVDDASGTILSIVRATEDSVAILYMEAGSLVLAVSEDDGSFIDQGTLFVDLETLGVKLVSNESSVTNFTLRTVHDPAVLTLAG